MAESVSTRSMSTSTLVNLGGGQGERWKAVRPPAGYKRAVNLFSQSWKIVYVEKLVLDGEELGGCSLWDERTIVVVVKGMAEGAIKDTLLHEICHSYLRMMPGFSDGKPTLSDEDDAAEETIVVAWTTAVQDLFNSNKWVRDLFLG